MLDEFGEADAWGEIANPLPVPLAVGKLKLTSAPGSATGWSLPDSTIAGSGYQIVWVDGEGAEGAWHADFALPVGGGFTGLVWSADSSVMDSRTSVSPGTVARIPDSVGPWTAWDAPSPGAFNPVPRQERSQPGGRGRRLRQLGGDLQSEWSRGRHDRDAPHGRHFRSVAVAVPAGDDYRTKSRTTPERTASLGQPDRSVGRQGRRGSCGFTEARCGAHARCARLERRWHPDSSLRVQRGGKA